MKLKLLDYFFGQRNKKTASVAKERLKIIVAHQRMQNSAPDFIPLLERELIEVISKYVDIDPEQIKVGLERDGEHSVLELNITLPEDEKAAA